MSLGLLGVVRGVQGQFCEGKDLGPWARGTTNFLDVGSAWLSTGGTQDHCRPQGQHSPEPAHCGQVPLGPLLQAR